VAAAVAKHFAVHSGPEAERHHFDARVDARDLAESYLPQFEAVVREGRVAGIMAAYNAINGIPAVANRWLLGDVLRRGWGFQGFVVGDCGAVGDLVGGHRLVSSQASAAARAIAAGTDLDCGRTYGHLGEALAAVPAATVQADLDAALVRLFTVRFRLGLLDPVEGTTGAGVAAAAAAAAARPVGAAGASVAVLLARHRALAREAAAKSMVLLDNPFGVLPIDATTAAGSRGRVHRLAVIGPTADDVEVLLGNYHGTPEEPVTLLRGVRAAAHARGLAVEYARGVSLAGRGGSDLAAAEEIARRADLVIACLGLSPALEGEEGDPDSLNPSGDRRDLGLPGLQPLLLRRLLATGKPVVVVLTGGGPVALPTWVRDAPPAAVLMAWYPGQEGGTALADVLFGEVSPSGRLPVTFPASVRDLPAFSDYRMRGRTYRYFAGQPAYPFGHGLGYGVLAAEDVTATVTARAVELSFAIVNPGPRARIHRTWTVPVFVEPAHREPDDPRISLAAFRRVELQPGASTAVTLALPLSAFHRTDAAGHRRRAPGPWRLHVGALDAPPISVEVPAADQNLDGE
jgi:beta-glucosidase